jgi:multicomponent K+:H+ antiporter subunit G
MIFFGVTEGRVSIHELLITFFLFITAPVTAHFIAKAYLHLQGEEQHALPRTGRNHGWSTFEAVDAPSTEVLTEPDADQNPHV